MPETSQVERIPPPVSTRSIWESVTDGVLLFFIFSRLWMRGGSISVWIASMVINSAIWTVYRLEIRPRLFRGHFSHLPAVPGGYPLLWHGTAQFSQPRGEAFLDMMKQIPNSGLIHLRGFLGQDCILLTSPEGLAEVLVRRAYSYTKPPGARNLFRRLFGESLIIAEGDEHRRLRKLMQPSFHYRRIRGLAPLLWSKAMAMNAEISRSFHHDAASITITTNVCDWSNKAMLDAIGIAMLGTDFNSLQQPSRMLDLYDAVTSTKPSVQAVFMASALLPSWMSKRLPGRSAKELAAAGNELRIECMKKVQQAREDEATLDGSDLLLSLVKSKEFTDEQLVDQFLLIIGAGYEPTTAAFAWTVWLLATHPEWQKRLREEIHSRFSLPCSQGIKEDVVVGGEPPDGPQPHDFDDSPILQAVCNEALRFMPTTPITTRIAAEDTLILGSGIPRGTRIFIVPYACNRSATFYGASAETFDPGRWIDRTGRSNNSGGADSNYAFLTFLHGPRKCIGDGYARLALRAFVAAFVGAFEFQMADANDIPAPGGILATKPLNGLRMKLRSCASE